MEIFLHSGGGSVMTESTHSLGQTGRERYNVCLPSPRTEGGGGPVLDTVPVIACYPKQ